MGISFKILKVNIRALRCQSYSSCNNKWDSSQKSSPSWHLWSLQLPFPCLAKMEEGTKVKLPDLDHIGSCLLCIGWQRPLTEMPLKGWKSGDGFHGSFKSRNTHYDRLEQNTTLKAFTIFQCVTLIILPPACLWILPVPFLPIQTLTSHPHFESPLLHAAFFDLFSSTRKWSLLL